MTYQAKGYKVYIAGPYSVGDVAVNVRNAIMAADAVMGAGCYPYCPHLSHYQHTLCPRPYEEWMALHMAWLATCDVLVRLPGESPGADREIREARGLGKPVFFGVSQLVDFVRFTSDMEVQP